MTETRNFAGSARFLFLTDCMTGLNMSTDDTGRLESEKLMSIQQSKRCARSLIRKLAGLVLSAAVTGSAASAAIASEQAQWLRVGANERFTLYYDKSTIQQIGTQGAKAPNQPAVWVGFDLHLETAMQGGIKVRSLTQRFEYDCAAEAWRKVAERLYADARFAGQPIKESSAQADWGPMPPGSIPDGFFALVCTAPAAAGAGTKN